MSSDDEIDYMSEDFLNKCVGNNDCRPGLLLTHARKRKIEIERKKRSDDETYRKRMKPIHVIQQEKLREGLETPLDSSNKGFALMQKMGYKSGMSLGKQGTGIMKPVDIVVKSDRIGIGWQELLNEKRRKFLEQRDKKEKKMDPLEYRALKSNQHHQKQIEADLIKSRKACHNLDYREGILSAHEYWFWPEHTWEYEEEEDEEYDDEYQEDEDNKDNDNDYQEQDEINKSSYNQLNKDKAEKIEKDLSEVFAPDEQLQILTSYLRSTYFYCTWCFTEYESIEDLERNCPGLTRQDHDD